MGRLAALRETICGESEGENEDAFLGVQGLALMHADRLLPHHCASYRHAQCIFGALCFSVAARRNMFLATTFGTTFGRT